jgi:hypothetical protein
MTQDIIDALRKVAAEFQAKLGEDNLLTVAADEIESLRRERDEARRDLCMEWVLRGRTYTMPTRHKFKPSAKDWAMISNWECFKEESK